MTMTFAVMALGAVLGGLVLRRDPTSGIGEPIARALGILAIPVVAIVLATELGFLQNGLMTQSLTGGQWLVVIGLAAIGPIVIEADKWIRRRSVSTTKPLLNVRGA
jgi:Ca2+-transporting ATPase